jgi:hypothetical protein
MTYRPPPTSSSSRAAETEELIARKATDVARWAQSTSLASQWDSRAKQAADLIGPLPVRVLDVGAGAMALRGFLPAGASYTPADVVERCEGCQVADLNKGEFPLGRYDWVSFLGVLEYVHDPAWALRRAGEAAPRMIVTYCTDSARDVDYRRGMGWVNDYDRAQFEALLSDTGWTIEETVEHKRGIGNIQYVWKCVRDGA